MIDDRVESSQCVKLKRPCIVLRKSFLINIVNFNFYSLLFILLLLYPIDVLLYPGYNYYELVYMIIII